MLLKTSAFILLAGFSFCNPKPPDPPATCPESCPTGTACTDPKVGCVPIEAPGHVCEVGKEFCNCYVMPPETGLWTLVTCPSGQECDANYQCKATPEPKCKEGQNCNCYSYVEVMDDWHLMTCSDPQKCENFVCKTPEIPPSGNCPKPLAPGSRVYMRDKAYGNGFDSTVRVYGDPQFCFLIHGVNVNDCHLEGWPNRAKCEMELLSGCPIWQYTPDEGRAVYRCSDNPNALASCDHFGDPVFRDDPKTPEFEGRPLECGLQRDEFGPNAGFFTIAHGGPTGCTSANGPYWHIRACRPDGLECGPWVKFCKQVSSMFRWDLWVKGAVASGFVAVVAVAPAILMDGVTKAEIWALLSGFAGGIALYCKTHPPYLHNHDEFKKQFIMHEFIKSFPDLTIAIFGLIITIALLFLRLWISSVRHHVEGHIEREEKGMWPKIDARFDMLQAKMYELHEEQLNRYTEVMDEISTIKAKIPNGEITQMHRLLEQVLEKMNG